MHHADTGGGGERIGTEIKLESFPKFLGLKLKEWEHIHVQTTGTKVCVALLRNIKAESQKLYKASYLAVFEMILSHMLEEKKGDKDDSNACNHTGTQKHMHCIHWHATRYTKSHFFKNK